MIRARSLEKRARRHAILDEYRQGEKVGYIAARYGVTDRTVARYAAEEGISRPIGRPQHWPDCPKAMRCDYALLKAKVPAALARILVEEGGRSC